MRVAVVGAGIIGVTTAYELAADGHEVIVYERRGTVAAETSFANAGVLAPGYVTPWAAPGMPRKVLGMLLARHAPVRLCRGGEPGLWRWIRQWRQACAQPVWQANRRRMQRLAFYSRERLVELTRALALDYEHSTGYLVLLRSAGDLALARPGLKLLAELNTRFKLVNAEQCRMIEPSLNAETALHAGIHLPDDQVGNCRQFAMLLRQQAEQLGARFQFRTRVEQVLAGRRPELRLAPVAPEDTPERDSELAPEPASEVDASSQTFDAVVICAALGAGALLEPHGLALPMRAVHGYSVTVPVRRIEAHPDHGPRSALMDERYKVAISRIGSRIRVAGSAELGGRLGTHDPAAFETLYKVLHDWFPGTANLAQPQHWKGARPMLPDGPPVLGASGIAGVWVNLGHGSSGWALACGSARVLADALARRTPAIDVEGLGIERVLRR